MLRKIISIAVVLIFLCLSLAILANGMTKSLGRDEQVYCTAGVLLSQGKVIYRDFSYPSQMPYHPLLYAALFRILNTTHFLLVARIFSCFCDILVAVCIVGIYRRVFSSFPISAMLLGASGAVLYVFNPFVDYANGFAWNNDVVVLCVVLSFWLFISIDFTKKSKYWRIAVIAALLTMATCMRATLALVQLLFFVVLLARPADSIKQKFKTILPFLIASAVVAIWPLWTIARAPRAFFLNIFRISMLNDAWVRQTGMFYSKLEIMILFFTATGCFVLILIAAYLCLAIFWKRRELTITNVPGFLLATMLALVFLIIAMIMPITWKQHLAMPVPFVIISFAFPLLYLRKLDSVNGPGKLFKMARVLVIACAITSVMSYPLVLHRVPRLFSPQSWMPIQFHQISQAIAEKTKNPKLILTLAPLCALEGGCDIYTEFSSGPFVYRVAHLMTPSDLETIKAAGPETLKTLLEGSPPSTVILGAEFDFLEAPLFQMAVQPDSESWEKRSYKNGPSVYYKR